MKSIKIGKEILRGEMAYPGKVWGKVRVFPDPKLASELDALKFGEIVVINKLYPSHNNYLVEKDKEGNVLRDQKGIAVPKVLGIITDTGGRTSHGAFVAREMLMIPAIVGTSPEDATKHLKTGDVVVMDADQGRVYEYQGGGEVVEEKVAKYEKLGLRLSIRSIILLKETTLKGEE